MAILKLTDICKDYQQGREPVRVLKNINLTVEKGDYLAIMGPSGSGKTTLMNIIGCLDVPTSGSYELDGKDLKDLKDDDLADDQKLHQVGDAKAGVSGTEAVDEAAAAVIVIQEWASFFTSLTQAPMMPNKNQNRNMLRG